MKLIHGNKLTKDQKAQVLDAFVHRNTKEHQYSRNANMSIFDAVEIPPIQTDAQWLSDNAFYFTKDGRLSKKHTHCEPSFLAEGE